MVAQLKAQNYIDPQTEAHYAFHNVTAPRHSMKHAPDFFEIFLITEGGIRHVINEQETPLTEGALVLVRPADIHYFQNSDTPECKLINLAFLPRTFEALQQYLDQDVRLRDMLDTPLPPTVLLSPVEKQQVLTQLETLNRIPLSRKHLTRLRLRALLVELFTSYFLRPADPPSLDIPEWLQILCTEMQKPPNFIEGRPVLLRLANRSPEHLGRTFKRYLEKTPSQYINDLRLNYAAKLLVHTDRTALDIALDAGFGNLSHFYHLFSKRWQVAPGEFRKRHRKELIP